MESLERDEIIMNIKDYDEAKKIFLNYNGSYFHMHREEVLSEYKKFNIPKETEIKWLKEKIEEILSKVNEEKSIKEKYDKYWDILYILTKILEDENLLGKTLKTFEKDLKYLDVFSITSILEILFDNGKLSRNLRKEVKKIIQKNDIKMHHIISKDHCGLNGTQFLTEEEIIERYRNILKNLD